MTTLPTLELTFRNVSDSPWEGEAVARFQGEPGEPFPDGDEKLSVQVPALYIGLVNSAWDEV